MALRLVQHITTPRTPTPPFGASTGFTDHWWHSRLLAGEDSHWWAISDEANREVARAEIEPLSMIGSTYGAVAPAEGFVEIALIEVREDLRRNGLGANAVALLMKAYPCRILAAFSEDADQFWAALGWTKHLHPEEPMLYKALFVSA